MAKLMILSVLLLVIHASFQYVPSLTCYGQICPSSTTNCKEYKKSSSDRSKIEVRISCLDDHDDTLKEYYFEEPSHLDRYTSYENTKYESVNTGISHFDPMSEQDIGWY